MQSNIFVVGCARSGTTLLRDMLGSHPDIASVLSESKFFTNFYQKYGDLRNSENLNKLYRDFFDTEFFKLTGLDSEVIKSKFEILDRTYKEFFSLIMNEYKSMQGKRIWLEKTPDQIRCIKTIANLYPKAKIFLVVRDIRDVSLSIRNIYFDPSIEFNNSFIRSLITALYCRSRYVCGIKDCLELKPEQWRIIRYERLVLDTDYLKNIFRWLNLNHLALPMNATIGVLQRANTSFDNFSGISGTPVGRWKTMMPLDDVFAFNILNSDLLRALNYEITYPKGTISYIKNMIREILLNRTEFIRFIRLYRGRFYQRRSIRKMINSWSLKQFEVDAS